MLRQHQFHFGVDINYKKLIMNKIIAIAAPLILSVLLHIYILNQELIPEAYYNIEDLITSKGYNFTYHYVITDDGYILKAFRIFKSSPNGKPILFMHGLAGNADCFLININSKAPAFRLVDEGFDVWVLNSRGNNYSRNHTIYDVESKEFWAYTASDITFYDIPTYIKYIKGITGYDKLSYIGHSHGASLMIAYLALNSDFSEDISVVISIAGNGPQVNLRSYMVKLALSNFFLDFADWIGIKVVMDSPSYWVAKLIQVFPMGAYYLSRDIYDYTIHKDKPEGIAYYALKFQGGVGINSLRYCKSLIESHGLIQLYDHGPIKNMELYGSIEPPIADYSKVKSKIAIIGGKYDKLIHPDDTFSLYKSLPKEIVIHYKIYEHDHGTFLLSKNMDYLEDVIRILNSNK
ncbi:unnamed protein product [Blepharisma stoltei]|uniref:Partial AB-hydrolase lipase domain-containing protein n=1 Tax=Blepharisma stoltei TaxID=1481888 RepID=A0AAU9IVV8_9CILI|nr:unnamed protein product [Blepharisma stoltei]